MLLRIALRRDDVTCEPAPVNDDDEEDEEEEEEDDDEDESPFDSFDSRLSSRPLIARALDNERANASTLPLPPLLPLLPS